jgi:hypothetical protein
MDKEAPEDKKMEYMDTKEVANLVRKEQESTLRVQINCSNG